MNTSTKKIVITDHGFSNINPERAVLEQSGYELIDAQCKSEADLLAATRDAFALIVQWAPITETIIRNLDHCRLIVRYGIGVDNLNLAAARERQIPVCNVPDYCIDEVSDHALGLAMALYRQLPATDRRVREGVWKIIPPGTVPACKDAIFTTLGFGRIARVVLKKAAAFHFKLAAFDPFVSEEEMQALGVQKITFEEALANSDILSLHLPLNDTTHHLINRETLVKMKSNAVLINTSRGGLINTVDLAQALISNEIGGAGIDVFEQEPLPDSHPILQAPNTILTSHTAWYSQRSIPILQQFAAEEVLRMINGEPLKNQVA
ncbi:C-terminal binding protein [Larkinella terrae]|uniref:C-terminal binding protein n=1 Tax=Larkinella terrae TaxID=2025311 RepID=A0A7K0EMF1_9BACT|nr:C-terminal binding protein [Larkinella terrae]MRS63020.1 C-terminal binding protein [Larkinella terrae]